MDANRYGERQPIGERFPGNHWRSETDPKRNSKEITGAMFWTEDRHIR